MKSGRLSVLLTARTRHPCSPFPSGLWLGLARVGSEDPFLQTVDGGLTSALLRPPAIPFSRESDPGFGPSFPSGSAAKNLPTGDVGSIPGSGRSPGGGQATDSSVLAWRSPWTEEPGVSSPWGRKELDTTGVT